MEFDSPQVHHLNEVIMLPVITVPRKIKLVDMVIAAGFAKSKREARHLIESGAIRINDTKVTNIDLIIEWPEKE